MRRESGGNRAQSVGAGGSPIADERTTDAVIAALQAGDPLAGAGSGVEVAAAVERTRAAVAGTRTAAAWTGTVVRRAAVEGTRAGLPPTAAIAHDAVPAAAFIRHPAPWGMLHVAASERGVVAIELACETSDFVDDLARRLHGDVVPAGPHVPATWNETLALAARQLDEYFTGARHSFDVIVDIEGVSAWERLVLEGARSLAYGEATSYGRLAQRIGRPRAARAVGNALGRNPVPIVIPCHRILAADGTIGGYGGASRASQARMLSVKRALLAIEGVAVRG